MLLSTRNKMKKVIYSRPSRPRVRSRQSVRSPGRPRVRSRQSVIYPRNRSQSRRSIFPKSLRMRNRSSRQNSRTRVSTQSRSIKKKGPVIKEIREERIHNLLTNYGNIKLKPITNKMFKKLDHSIDLDYLIKYSYFPKESLNEAKAKNLFNGKLHNSRIQAFKKMPSILENVSLPKNFMKKPFGEPEQEIFNTPKKSSIKFSQKGGGAYGPYDILNTVVGAQNQREQIYNHLDQNKNVTCLFFEDINTFYFIDDDTLMNLKGHRRGRDVLGSNGRSVIVTASNGISVPVIQPKTTIARNTNFVDYWMTKDKIKHENSYIAFSDQGIQKNKLNIFRHRNPNTPNNILVDWQKIQISPENILSIIKYSFGWDGFINKNLYDPTYWTNPYTQAFINGVSDEGELRYQEWCCEPNHLKYAAPDGLIPGPPGPPGNPPQWPPFIRKMNAIKTKSEQYQRYIDQMFKYKTDIIGLDMATFTNQDQVLTRMDGKTFPLLFRGSAYRYELNINADGIYGILDNYTSVSESLEEAQKFAIRASIHNGDNPATAGRTAPHYLYVFAIDSNVPFIRLHDGYGGPLVPPLTRVPTEQEILLPRGLIIRELGHSTAFGTIIDNHPNDLEQLPNIQNWGDINWNYYKTRNEPLSQVIFARISLHSDNLDHLIDIRKENGLIIQNCMIYNAPQIIPFDKKAKPAAAGPKPAAAAGPPFTNYNCKLCKSIIKKGTGLLSIDAVPYHLICYINDLKKHDFTSDEIQEALNYAQKQI